MMQPDTLAPRTSTTADRQEDSALRAHSAPTYLCVRHESRDAAVIRDPLLATFTERHRHRLELPVLLPKSDIAAEVVRADAAGIVFVMTHGYASKSLLRSVAAFLAQQRAVFFYWPREEAIERIDAAQLRTYWRLWFLLVLYAALKAPSYLARTIYRMLRRFPMNADGTFLPIEPADGYRYQAQDLIAWADPVPLPELAAGPSRQQLLPGYGVYLRMDFWANNQSGGSTGHTCHVAKELSAVTEQFLGFMPIRFDLLDHYGVRQVVPPRPPGPLGDELTILQANTHYYAALKTTFELIRPAYIYERLCLGSYVGARLSQEFRVPYIVEYNGSEISMKRSFGDRPYDFEKQYLAAEMAAFSQATLISVVSQPIKDELVARGIPADRVLVNPNAVDVNEYRPLADDQKTALRREFDWDASHCVIGFTGTFGGWHGIDVLAQALPEICKRVPHARILLIGDGNCKHLIDEAIVKHDLGRQVRSVGRVAQREGARLLGACDLFLSPHHKHMVDSKFFGSPTKIFEYMGMGGGIVASDLEQIGEVLSPALRAADLTKSNLVVGNERAVLCRPGDVAEFVDAVVHLAQRPEIYQALGRNARAAACEHYTWERHVANLWRHRPCVNHAAGVNGSNGYQHNGSSHHGKNGTKHQHVIKPAESHTLDWYLEVERQRYGEFAPWMPRVLEFAQHAGKEVLEIGGGLGTDLAQFARHGARVTDVDLSAEPLGLAQENFRLRGLKGNFVHHDAEALPFADESFDVVYSHGFVQHMPNTQQAIGEIRRVLKPGGRAIVTMPAQSSLFFWGRVIVNKGLNEGFLGHMSVGEVLSRHARPPLKACTRQQARDLFRDFNDVAILQRQLTRAELPRLLRWLPLGLAGRLMGSNLIIKATKGR